MRKTGIGIISPANGLMHFFPNRIEYGKKYMEKNNFSIYFGKNSLKCVSYYSADVDDRISDINEAINDNNVDIIMASIGGYNSNQLLEKINYKKIKESNKIFCGYSDISCLILAIYVKTQKIMLHGPTFLAELCEYPQPFDYTWNYFLKAVNREKIEYVQPKYEVTEYVDWKVQENKFVERKKEVNKYNWQILKKGATVNPIIGGNLSSIITIIGSEYLPINIFNNKILFLEDVDISIAEFDSLMQGLKLQGVFEKISGLIIGKFVENSNNEEIRAFLTKFLIDYDIPIIYNVDLGHTNPKITIPIGAVAKLECNDKINFNIIDYKEE